MIALLFSFLLFPWSHWSFACHIEGLADGKLVLIVPSAAAVLLPLLLTARQFPVHQFSWWSSPQGSNSVKLTKIGHKNTTSAPSTGDNTIWMLLKTRRCMTFWNVNNAIKRVGSPERGFRIDTVAQFSILDQALLNKTYSKLFDDACT